MQRASTAHTFGRRRLVGCVIAGLALFFVAFWILLVSISHNGQFAFLASFAETAAAAVSTALTLQAAWSGRLLSRRRIGVTWASWAIPPTLVIVLVLAAFGMPVAWATGVGAAAGVAVGCFQARSRHALTALQTLMPVRVQTVAEAEVLRRATEQPLSDPHVPAERVAMRQVNHARALSSLALSDLDADRPVESLALLRAAVQNHAVDPAVAFLAADELIGAESALAERSHNRDRYAAAIELFAGMVNDNPQIDGGKARLHGHRADYQTFLMRGASEDLEVAAKAGDEPGAALALDRVDAACLETERQLRAAIALTADGAIIRPTYLAQLGAHLAQSSLWEKDRTDDGVGLVRQALELPAARKDGQHDLLDLLLALSLLARYQLRREPADADEISRLLRRLTRKRGPAATRAQRLRLEFMTILDEERQGFRTSLDSQG
jgi:hypothetical protein